MVAALLVECSDRLNSGTIPTAFDSKNVSNNNETAVDSVSLNNDRRLSRKSSVT